MFFLIFCLFQLYYHFDDLLNYTQNQVDCQIIKDLRQIVTVKSDCDGQKQTIIVIEKLIYHR